jgi:hypothetical protein
MGMGKMPADGIVPFGLMPHSDGMNNIANDQSQLSRSSSMNRQVDASTRGNSYDQPYNGDVLAYYSMPAEASSTH